MLYSIAKQTRHAGQIQLTISSPPPCEAEKVEQRYRSIAAELLAYPCLGKR
jgi:hypothetical protein